MLNRESTEEPVEDVDQWLRLHFERLRVAHGRDRLRLQQLALQRKERADATGKISLFKNRRSREEAETF